MDNPGEAGHSTPAHPEPGTDPLTHIADCLQHVREHPDQSVGLRVAGCVTLVDRERSLMVVQDVSGAMAVHAPLAALTVTPGQQVVVEGNGVFPCVRAFPKYPDDPSERGCLSSFELPPGHGTYFLSRFRGYLHPPVGGTYMFWISADDAGELFLSSDASPENKQKIAANKIGNATGPQQWDLYSSQRSEPVNLKAGETYYIEALQVQGYGRDYLGVAWQYPGTNRSIIAGSYLTPWMETSAGAVKSLAGQGPPATNGIWREGWTNFLAYNYNALQTQYPFESTVRIHGLKLTVTGSGVLPPPLVIDEDASLDSGANLQWVELGGYVSFAAANEGQLQLDLKREDSILGVQVLNLQGLSPGRLMDAHVHIRGILEHAYGPHGEVASSVLWVQDGRQIKVVEEANRGRPDLNQISICDLDPGNPEMTWGRRVSVRGRICDHTTNGLLVVQGEDNYQAFCSADGTNWISLGKPVEIGMSNSVLTGLALASHAVADSISGSFAHLQGFGTNWRASNIGGHFKTSTPGTFSSGPETVTLTGGGRLIGERADQQFYLYQPLDEEADLEAEVTLPPQVVSRPQIGLMIRESLDAQAPYAAVLFTPAHGPAFQYRPSFNALSLGFEANGDFRDAQWLKLMKRKSLLLVQPEDASAVPGADQELRVTGMITWRKGTPVLTETSFQNVAKVAASLPPASSNDTLSIPDFVFKAQHPPEPFLYSRMPASNLRGIVTFCGTLMGSNLMFVQEGNEGGIKAVWKDAKRKLSFKVGQLVEMHGYAAIRKFPVVFDPLGVDFTGWGTLPEPAPYAADLVKSGAGQARWVEATGVMRSVDTNGLFSLMTKDGSLAVWVDQRPNPEAGELVDTQVRLRGVLAMDASHAAQLLVPSPGFVEVVERAPPDPFAVPRFSIAELGALELKPEQLRRMKLGGVVTCALPQGIYVQDETGGAYLETGAPTQLHPGDRVEAVGFPNTEFATMILSGASVRRIGGGTPLRPSDIAIDQIDKKKWAGRLVHLAASLLEQRDMPQGQRLTLQQGTQLLEAERLADGQGRLPKLPAGSLVAITGVLQVDQGMKGLAGTGSDAASALTSLKVWLPNGGGLVLLKAPPWWTAKRMAWLGGVFATAFLGALLWARMLRRRVAEQTRQLRSAMQELEKETRTSAMLAERDRLAGEIHDSLEQGLTAIMMQLDVANKQVDQSPETRRILGMARNMAEFSRSEVQHAVWDLQSPLLATADLGVALKRLVDQISSGPAKVKVELVGAARPMPSSDEHHLLRIAQEAITNAFKHGHPANITVLLDYSGQEVKLSIADDGCGFVPGASKTEWQNGHFGLQGMRARAKKIGAAMAIDSQVGKGTVVTVHMNLNAEPNANAANMPVSP
jgi:signal transduction histidine kinase